MAMRRTGLEAVPPRPGAWRNCCARPLSAVNPIHPPTTGHGSHSAAEEGIDAGVYPLARGAFAEQGQGSGEQYGQKQSKFRVRYQGCSFRVSNALEMARTLNKPAITSSVVPYS